ncbi:MAG TPA: 2-succinyl-5-enolpyruvyl-6-hydroxy-3-cyclohexene-1-carboxylic-acid synthase, partial [Acidimicrobiia bacterium]|nr:2-succinyl-5-enolpyruvyl-6-hydroxy-3-cyclohexene-1-carboxylic-acid synthase [Acidimicrobiia bacterium]
HPVVLVTTSGTAAAELLPAVVEARYGRVPLIAITADRPGHLRDVGAPQTIDQRDLFGGMVAGSWAVDLSPTEPAPDAASLATALFVAATGPPPGAAHLNVGFDEPLLGDPDPSAPGTGAYETPAVRDPETGGISEALGDRRGILVIGPQDSPDVVDAAAAFAAAARWPILADPLSGLRAGRHDRSSVVGHGDLLAATGWVERAAPGAIIRVGALPTSKPLWRWMESASLPHVFVEPHGWRDPISAATVAVPSDPAATLLALSTQIPAAPSQWQQAWKAADAAAGAAIDATLAETPFPNEPAVARALATALPDGAVVWLASSMPVRDADSFFGSSPKDIRFLANRGVNGIDGFVSSALGSAAVTAGPTVAVSGDLSLLHDLNALVTAKRLGIPITIVVVNNDGGGIFHFLPQRGHAHFERHFATPHGVRFTPVAAALGIDAHEVTDHEEFADLLRTIPDGPRLLEVRTDREENVAVHQQLQEAVRRAVIGG